MPLSPTLVHAGFAYRDGSVDDYEKAFLRYYWKNLNRKIKTVAVADGGGNLDNEAIANGSWDAGHVLFSKTGHEEKVKAVKAMRNPGRRRISQPQSPHAPQGTRKAMSISHVGCANLVPAQR
ncbi:MAG: hypothetical protein ACYCOR_00535 [Acidobacteriaceae bacterium]